MDPTTDLVIRCSDDMVEAFRARKEQLGLSNAAIEEQLLSRKFVGFSLNDVWEID